MSLKKEYEKFAKHFYKEYVSKDSPEEVKNWENSNHFMNSLIKPETNKNGRDTAKILISFVKKSDYEFYCIEEDLPEILVILNAVDWDLKKALKTEKRLWAIRCGKDSEYNAKETPQKFELYK